MKTETIVMCVVALLFGMLLANMLKNVCGCKLTEGNVNTYTCQSFMCSNPNRLYDTPAAATGTCTIKNGHTEGQCSESYLPQPGPDGAGVGCRCASYEE